MSRRNSIKQRPDSDLRAEWLAELKECDKRRTSLHRQIKQAQRAGNSRKVADLEKQYGALSPDRKLTESWAGMDSRSWGRLSGVLTDDELDKTVPQSLRNRQGRAAWAKLIYWRRASEGEKRGLWEKLSRLWHSGNDAAYALYYMSMRLDDDPEFFSMLAIALKKEGSAAFEKVKADLLLYRLSLNWSRTPGQPRHTIAEIKQIVDPTNRMPSFRNMIYTLKVPHLVGKRGQGSPNYGSGKKRWRA